MTPAEKLLWSRLRRRAVAAMKFRREQPISGFHADFYCDRAGVVVEVDGGVHEARRERDAERTAVIEGRALLVIRFTNDQVMNDVDAVCREIIATCLRRRARG
jgi:very-short-patch-repair endonuclease